jgi:Tol biopolymer transport system component
MRLPALALLAAAVMLPACRSRLPRRDILFQSVPPGNTEDIWALNPRDAKVRRITQGDSGSANGVPVWSPDGQRIAFVRELPDHDELYIIDQASAPPRRIGGDAPRSLAFPDWSPDGSALLFNGGATIDQMGVYLIQADGSGLRQILSDSVSYRCPSWAPDGHGFIVARSTPFSSDLVEVDLAGEVLRTRAFSDSTFLDCPQWSPNGKLILFTAFHGGVDPRLQPASRIASDLQVLDLASGKMKPITRGPGLNHYGRWGRDSRWIVFQSDRQAASDGDSVTASQRLDHLEIYIVRADGRRLKRLTTNQYFDGSPSW